MDPLVSVVIPTYGRPEFVVRAVESVAAQTYKRIELFVVDDHSPEAVAPALEQVDTSALVRTVCRRHEVNRGANAARNTGIRESRGDIVAFLDDDDRWEPTAVERYVETFRESPSDVGLVSVGVRIEDSSGAQIGLNLPRFSGDALDVLLGGSLVGSFSRFAVTREVVEAAGLPDEGLPSWQDWEWQFRLARHCRFASVPEPLVVRTEGDHEQITDDFEERRDVSYPRLLEAHREYVAAERGRRGERQFVALLTRTLGTSALHAGRYRDAVRYLFKSLRADPTQTRTYLFLAVALGGPLTNRYGRRVKRRFSGTF
ncbi:Glycosyltransferase like family 2 [Halogranum gelatinilyticum]|uniref:Glycosyltransferase like family 2 n=1 Tax=Halogranum gelatinilyticum TaxID=660521 RepID=A0A1G9UMF8_9EURY|nr:glycosyltransferase family A protein [Halogranum gelatinilyticum]SDM61047.1 Glycosyltransferase like family 2 [Halogranum gelatinilyticum]